MNKKKKKKKKSKMINQDFEDIELNEEETKESAADIVSNKYKEIKQLELIND